jgi:hypothetical protein
MGDIVDFGIGLSYQPAGLCSQVGQYNNPVSRNNFIPLVKDYEFGYSPSLSTVHDINFGELVLSKLKRTIGDSA